MPIQKPLCVKPLPLLSLASSPAAIDVGRAVTNLGEFRHYSMIYEVASTTATVPRTRYRWRRPTWRSAAQAL